MTPPVVGADLRAALVASCLRGAVLVGRRAHEGAEVGMGLAETSAARADKGPRALPTLATGRLACCLLRASHDAGRGGAGERVMEVGTEVSKRFQLWARLSSQLCPQPRSRDQLIAKSICNSHRPITPINQFRGRSCALLNDVPRQKRPKSAAQGRPSLNHNGLHVATCQESVGAAADGSEIFAARPGVGAFHGLFGRLEARSQGRRGPSLIRRLWKRSRGSGLDGLLDFGGLL